VSAVSLDREPLDPFAVDDRELDPRDAEVLDRS
jgi:hypothetical protein